MVGSAAGVERDPLSFFRQQIDVEHALHTSQRETPFVRTSGNDAVGGRNFAGYVLGAHSRNDRRGFDRRGVS